MKSETTQDDGRLFLKLNEWELANLHLPAVTTVTFYSKEVSIEFLRRRVVAILKNHLFPVSRV